MSFKCQSYIFVGPKLCYHCLYISEQVMVLTISMGSVKWKVRHDFFVLHLSKGKKGVQCKPDISRSCIPWNWIYRGRMLDLIFWRPWARYFSRNRGNSLDPIRGKHFFAKSAHRDITFVPVRGRQFFTKSTPAQTLAYLSMRAGTHAVRWPGTLGGPLTPPLCRRVGSS